MTPSLHAVKYAAREGTSSTLPRTESNPKGETSLKFGSVLDATTSYTVDTAHGERQLGIFETLGIYFTHNSDDRKLVAGILSVIVEDVKCTGRDAPSVVAMLQTAALKLKEIQNEQEDRRIKHEAEVISFAKWNQVTKARNGIAQPICVKSSEDLNMERIKSIASIVSLVFMDIRKTRRDVPSILNIMDTCAKAFMRREELRVVASQKSTASETIKELKALSQMCFFVFCAFCQSFKTWCEQFTIRMYIVLSQGILPLIAAALFIRVVLLGVNTFGVSENGVAWTCFAAMIWELARYQLVTKFGESSRARLIFQIAAIFILRVLSIFVSSESDSPHSSPVSVICLFVAFAACSARLLIEELEIVYATSGILAFFILLLTEEIRLGLEMSDCDNFEKAWTSMLLTFGAVCSFAGFMSYILFGRPRFLFLRKPFLACGAVGVGLMTGMNLVLSFMKETPNHDFSTIGFVSLLFAVTVREGFFSRTGTSLNFRKE